MLSLPSSLCILLLCFTSLTFSAPTSPTNNKKLKGRSFKIERVRSSNYFPNGPAALRRAYGKYGIQPASDISLETLDFVPLPSNTANINAADTAADPEETGAVANQPTANDVEYLSPVTVGGQKMAMNFDTGSSDMWVFNTKLATKQQTGHTIYDPTQSSTSQTLVGSTFNITYGDASFASGSVGMDTVDIGGATVENQAIGLPNVVSDSFAQDTASNGLVGLAFSTINTVQPTQQRTFFDNLMKDLDTPVMSAQLKAAAAGSYEFGIIDPTKFSGKLANISVDNSNGFWEFKTTMFAVNNTDNIQTVSAAGSATSAIADTGTSLMLVNDEIAQAYYEQVPNARNSQQAGGFIYPCSTTLPNLSVSIGDTHLATVPGNVINFSEVGTDTQTGQKLCFGGVQGNSGSSLQIYGDIFFKAMFVVFDQRGPSLGMAAHA